MIFIWFYGDLFVTLQRKIKKVDKFGCLQPLQKMLKPHFGLLSFILYANAFRAMV